MSGSWGAVGRGAILTLLSLSFGCRPAAEPGQPPPSAAPSAEVPGEPHAEPHAEPTAAGDRAAPADDPAPSVNGSVDAAAGGDRWFTDITAETGIAFSFESGREAGEFAILESLGGGVAAFDYDRDGAVDLMFAGGGSLANQTITPRPCGLFRNAGRQGFVDVTEPAGGAAARFFQHGIFPGDFDADGFPDLAVSGYGGVQVFRNRGDGTFQPFAVWQTHPEHPWSSSLAWGDFNRDGKLDLYVTHYVDWSWENHPICPGPRGVEREVCAPREFAGVSDAVYQNDGRGGFRRVDAAIGLVPGGKGLGVVAGDVNLDGAVDLYVANDTTDNFLYLNDGAGQLTEAGMLAGVATDEVGVNTGSMGVALQDVDGDGWPDLWVTNFERELFALYHNETSGLFSHVSRARGLAATQGLYVGFGTVLVDADRDGDRDIVVANGHVSYASPYAPYRQVPLLLENQGGKRFVPRQESGYFATPHTGRGLATADLDHDGGTELILTHLEEPVAVLRGRPPEDDRWALVELVGTASDREAIGASIVLPTDAGERRWMVNAGGSYLSQHDRRQHLAWPASAADRRAEVHWPSGRVETFPLPPATTRVVWVEGDGAPL